MDRQDNKNSVEPDFEAFDDLRAVQRGLLPYQSAVQHGGVVAVGGIAEWKLFDLALASLQIQGLSEVARVTVCISLAILMVVVVGLVALFIRSSTKDASKQTSTNYSTQPRHQSGGP